MPKCHLPTMAVAYPASRSICASVSRPGSIKQGPSTPANTPRMPVRNGMRPVRMPYRAGVQTVDGLWASVKRRPCRARLSRCLVSTLARLL